MKSSRTWIYGLLAVMVTLTSAWLTRFNDDGLGTTWTHHVLRNWEQFGIFKLRSDLVYNPGGHGVETQPMICTSHRAASLYPVYLCHQLFGGQLGVFLYYALVAGIVFWSIWQLLAKTQAAFWLGAMVVLMPGFARWQTTLDPNLAAAVFGFPYCAAILALMRQPAWRWPQVILLALLILAFSAVNWTTAFVHGMLVAFLVVAPGIPWRRILIYVGLGVVMAGLVVAVSVADKVDPAKGGGVTKMLAGYGWGDAGYGEGLATGTALLRIAFVNFIGLLPVWAFLVWRARWPGFSAKVVVGFLPLASAVGSLLVLRNYAGHHPWMTCHFILLGLILSVALLKSQLPVRPAFKSNLGPAWLLAAFGYAWLMLAFGHRHDAQQLAVIHFIRDQTPRAATLVVAQDRDPGLIKMISRLEMDRHYILVPSLNGLEAGGTNQFILTSVEPAASNRFTAHLDIRDSGSNWMSDVLAWYSRVIAHRRPGDKVDVLGTDYYLYQP